MNACLSPEGLAAYSEAATIIIYGGIAGAVAWVGFVLLQMHWDAANRKRRIDGIEPQTEDAP